MTMTNTDAEVAAFAGLTIDELLTQRATAADLADRLRRIAIDLASIVEAHDAMLGRWALDDGPEVDERFDEVDRSVGTTDVDSLFGIVGAIAGRPSSWSTFGREFLDAEAQRLGVDPALLG